MKTINTLIRFQQQKVDALRRQMGTVENTQQQYLSKHAQLENELKDELVLAGQRPDMATYFGNYAQRVRLRQEELMEEVQKLEQELEKLREEMRLLFGELKRFEILKDKKVAEIKANESRRDTIELDEMAAQGYKANNE